LGLRSRPRWGAYCIPRPLTGFLEEGWEGQEGRKEKEVEEGRGKRDVRGW